jgi:hypothetical protein
VSRGPGYVQRLILEELDERVVGDDPWVDVRAIAERLEDVRPLGHACRSVRRALRLLAADGLVEIASIAPARVGDPERVLARIAVARLDEAAIRRARRTQARELRRDLGVSLLRWRRDALPVEPGPEARRDGRA